MTIRWRQCYALLRASNEAQPGASYIVEGDRSDICIACHDRGVELPPICIGLLFGNPRPTAPGFA